MQLYLPPPTTDRVALASAGPRASVVAMALATARLARTIGIFIVVTGAGRHTRAVLAHKAAGIALEKRNVKMGAQLGWVKQQWMICCKKIERATVQIPHQLHCRSKPSTGCCRVGTPNCCQCSILRDIDLRNCRSARSACSVRYSRSQSRLRWRGKKERKKKGGGGN